MRWNDETGINRENHAAYLEKFAAMFYDGIKTMLDRAVSEEVKLSKDELYTEV